MKLRGDRTEKEAASHLQIPLTHPATENMYVMFPIKKRDTRCWKISLADVEDSTTSNLASRLLQLPQELKNQIYTYLLGGQCMHVQYYDDTQDPFVLYACCATATASSGQRVFDTATRIDTAYKLDNETEQDMDSETDPSNFNSTDPHRRCYYPRSHGGMQTARRRIPRMSRRNRGGMFNRKTTHLPVGLLRTCRQIYHEANQIMYSTNTFSFQRPEAVKEFISHLKSIPSGSRTFAIRHLHLYMRIDYKSDETEWNRALSASARAFTNLRSLGISIEQNLWNRKQEDRSKEFRKNPSMSHHGIFLAGMLGFRKVGSLKEMTLVVTDTYPREVWRPSKFRWTDAQKQKWARDVRADILGGDKD